MTQSGTIHGRTIRLYPWFKFAQNLVFWQAIWFLFFQSEVSAAQAIVLYAIYDISTTIIEVPSGWMSDTVGRRVTLVGSAAAGVLGGACVVFGDGFAAFALAQIAFGAAAALSSGSDSALLFESLKAEGRAEDIEAQELRAWRFSFVALALSAVSGGVLALYDPLLTFAGSALASLVALLLAMLMRDTQTRKVRTTRLALQQLGNAFSRPVLQWLFTLSVVMYGFSHLPFVFGQPYIAEALAPLDWQADAPLVSGAVTTVMMVLSVLTSLGAQRLRHSLGLTPLLLLAFGVQIAIVAALAMTNSVFVIAVLFLRMVPDSMSRPFILARIQPMLADDSRATYLSVRSLCARVLFAGSLALASTSVTDAGALPFGEISFLLGWYALAGLAILTGLVIWAAALGSSLGREDGQA